MEDKVIVGSSCAAATILFLTGLFLSPLWLAIPLFLIAGVCAQTASFTMDCAAAEARQKGRQEADPEVFSDYP